MKFLKSPIAEQGRSTFLKGLLILGLTLIAGCAPARAPSAQISGSLYSSVSVDLSPIKATGLGSYADRMGAYLERDLRAVFAGPLDPKNRQLPALVVEIRSIHFGTYEPLTRLDVFPMRRGGTKDSLQGTAVIVKGGKELARIPVLAVLTSMRFNPESMADEEPRLIA
ncbi:MAG: hypothetical protein RL543_1311, partial [Pseudomonadota bacterium]